VIGMINDINIAIYHIFDIRYDTAVIWIDLWWYRYITFWTIYLSLL